MGHRLPQRLRARRSTGLLAALALPAWMLLWACAQGASFDCAKAATWVERALCGDPTLGTLDERMAAAYRTAQDAASANREALLTGQRDWLASRNRCTTTVCLRRLYDERIAALAGPAAAARTGIAQGSIRESGPHFSIDANYPILSGSGPAIESANREIRRFVEGLVAPFRTEQRESAAIGQPEGPPWSLDIDYDQPYWTDRYLAIQLGGYDFRGGAHGMPIIEPLVIDLADGRRVLPEELFLRGTDWLDALSKRCYAALRGRDLLGPDEDWLKTGTAPKPENYRLLYPGPDGLTVTFPPYAVAPNAAGPQEVLVPYADLGPMLDPGLFARSGR